MRTLWVKGRGLMITMLVLFGICFFQATYWVVDQGAFARGEHAAMVDVLRQQADWANDHLEEGQRERWAQGHPHIHLKGDSFEVDPARLSELRDKTDRRINRYRWEGGFFLLVLLAGSAVLVRTLRQHGSLLKRQSNFLASVGHELKSPLASIKLSAETMEMRELDAGAVQRLSQRMLSDVFRLEKFVGNVLDSARLDAGTREHDRVPLSLDELVSNVVREVGSRYPEVKMELQAEGRGSIKADEIGTRAVIQNLIDNACKSVKAAGNGMINVSLSSSDSRVEFSVADGGLGFPAGEQERIFQRFYRVGNEMTRKTKGSGLGLYIARAAVEMDGGRLTAHSDGPGQGATFTAVWPLSSHEETSA